jgi:hypothetical protein
LRMGNQVPAEDDCILRHWPEQSMRGMKSINSANIRAAAGFPIGYASHHL